MATRCRNFFLFGSAKVWCNFFKKSSRPVNNGFFGNGIVCGVPGVCDFCPLIVKEDNSAKDQKAGPKGFWEPYQAKRLGKLMWASSFELPILRFGVMWTFRQDKRFAVSLQIRCGLLVG